MTIAKWKLALEDLGLSAPPPADPPDGESGAWFNAQTRFERRGFIRILVREGEELRWHVEAAHPALNREVLDLAVAALARQSGGEWTYEQTDDAQFTLTGDAPEEYARQTLVPLLLFGDAVAADRDHLGDLAERLTRHAAPDESASDEASDSEGAADSTGETTDEATDEDSGPVSEPTESPDPGASPFETIGDDKNEPTATQPIFAIEVTDERIELGLGLPYQLDAETYDKVVSAWSRSLRGRYDVTAAALEPDANRAIDLSNSESRVMLVVRPDALTGSVTVADVAPDLHDHIDTLQKVTAAGIDPLVFLGVRISGTTRADGTNRAIDQTDGSDESDGSDNRGTSSSNGPFEVIGETSSDGENGEIDRDDDAGVLLVASDPEDDEPGGLILDLSAPPADGDPLERGRFDDPRLKTSDATTQLVDVVLRHPGYSDRNIGQVLSILLSIDYSDALDLADSAPRVIAWGVGNDRGNTMKTVIEGAGGKVLLVEPDTFSPR